MKMSSVEGVVWELLSDEDINEHGEGGLPPGFRFHPTDEELLTFYLASKVLLMFDGTSCGIDIAEVDLNTCEPWDLPDLAKMGERQWCCFSLRDRKYPSGFRTNRATGAGHWKATGKDRQIYSATTGTLLGMKKTLVFYKGRAPSGEKTRWVMHEYRLHDHFRHTPCTEEWVICRIFHKIGKERNPIVFQDQSSTPLLETSAATTTAMVELSQSPSQIQRYISDMSDLNMLTNPILPQQNAHQINHLQPYFSPKPISPPHPNKNKHTYQPNTSIPKQCKTEANFIPFHLPYTNLRCWVDNVHRGPFADKYSILPGMDGVLIGFSSPAPDTTDTTNVPVVASTSMAFSGADMQP